jgi:hypothetical protein
MLSVRAVLPEPFRDWARGNASSWQVRWFGGIFVDVRQLLRSARSVATTCVHGPYHLTTSLAIRSIMVPSLRSVIVGLKVDRAISEFCVSLVLSCEDCHVKVVASQSSSKTEPRHLTALRFVSGSNFFRARPSRCPLLFHVSHSIFKPRPNDRPAAFHVATARETSPVLIAPQSLHKSLKDSHECSGRTGNVQPCSTRSYLLSRLVSYILIHPSQSLLPPDPSSPPPPTNTTASSSSFPQVNTP